ncbi:MAG: outer membrane beta-barrel protein [Beijerinckiaceae bacterium]
MGDIKSLALAAGLIVSSASVTIAADLPAPAPIVPLRGPIEPAGFYLRGDIGFSNQEVERLDNALYSLAPTANLSRGFDAAPFGGFGIGYKFNSWIRTDLTVEYRARANFKGLDRYVDPTLPTGFGTDEYHGSKSEWVGLANVYFDLGNWWSFTPFVGVGIGTAYNTISNFRDTNITTAGVAYAPSASMWNLAWALHAGVAYDVTPNFAIEFGYRYLALGDARSGDLTTYNGVNLINNPMVFRNLTSHDFKLGFRWLLGGDYAPAPPVAVMRRG